MGRSTKGAKKPSTMAGLQLRGLCVVARAVEKIHTGLNFAMASLALV